MKNADMPAQAVSAESGKAVERFDCSNGGAQYCQGCYTMAPDSDGQYVRHEDYAKLENQRAALVEALTRLRGEWKYQCDIGNVPDGRIELDLADAALRAAGVEL